MAADNLGFGNPYLQQSLDAALGDTVKAYNNVTAPAFTSAMVRSGSFGNSGLAQMQQDAQSQLQQNLGRQANDFRANNYWQDQNFNKSVYDTTFNQNQQQFGNALNLLGMQNQMGMQNLGLGTNIQNTPLSYYQGFANTANGIGQGYGTSTGTSSAQGSPVMGALGGWQLGGQMAKGWGGGSSGGWSGTSNAPFFYGNGTSGD